MVQNIKEGSLMGHRQSCHELGAFWGYWQFDLGSPPPASAHGVAAPSSAPRFQEGMSQAAKSEITRHLMSETQKSSGVTFLRSSHQSQSLMGHLEGSVS